MAICKSLWLQRALFFYFAVTSLSMSAIAGQTTTAQQCGVDQKQHAQRFFADPKGTNKWKEYGSIDAIPELSNDAGIFARQWSGNNGDALLRTEEPGEDFATYSDYCFDSRGQLVQLRFELRTAWGWGFRKEGPVVRRFFKPKISEFFSTKTEMRVPKPEQAADIPDALKPRIYLRKSQLPFYKLLLK